MYGGLTVSTWVKVDDGCSVTYDVIGSGQTDFVFCDEQAFGIAMEPDALREFLKAGAKALDEMETLYATEQADEQPQGVA